MSNTPDPRILEEHHGVWFLECVQTCLLNSEFRTEWERLSWRKLLATNPIERMIDEATGYSSEVMREFADFVYEYVFSIL